MVKTAERLEFLGDIVTTAVEGGTGYWAQVSQYQYTLFGKLTVHTGEQVGDDTRAVLHEMNEDETGYRAEALVLDTDAVARGIGRITRGEVRTGEYMTRLVTEASRENEAGDIDADAADVIAQAALLNEIRYG